MHDDQGHARKEQNQTFGPVMAPPEGRSQIRHSQCSRGRDETNLQRSRDEMDQARCGGYREQKGKTDAMQATGCSDKHGDAIDKV